MKKLDIVEYMLNLTLGAGLALAGSMPLLAADEHAHHHHHAAAAKPVVGTLASYKIPGIRLLESNGKEVLLSQTIRVDKPVMLNFIFTTCTAICPVMSAAFAQVAQENQQVQLISVSIDPEQDTPVKMKEYAARFGNYPQWRLFTGTVGDSIKVQQAFDAYRGDKMNHVPLTLVRAAHSNQWLRMEGLASAADLNKALQSLPKNKTNGQ